MARIVSGIINDWTEEGFCVYTAQGAQHLRAVRYKPQGNNDNSLEVRNRKLLSLEFAACSKLAGNYARPLVNIFPYVKPWNVHASVSGVFSRVQSLAPKSPILRDLIPARYADSVLGTEFNKQVLFKDMCRFGFSQDYVSADGSLLTRTEPMLPSEAIHGRRAADYFRLVVVAFAVPALCYDSAINDFRVNAERPLPAMLVGHSPYVPFSLKKAVPVSVKISLGDNSTLPAGAAWMVCTGLELYTGSINKLSLLDDVQCLMISKTLL
jgi:hypothetical protein